MNIADNLTKVAGLFPDKTAVRFPVKTGESYLYKDLSFKELESKINKYSNGLIATGFKKGQKVLLFVRPSLEFHALVFALYKIGAIPLLIDPGMGRKNLLAAIKEVRPEGLVAEAEVHFLSLLFSDAFKSVKHKITTKGLTWGKMRKLDELLQYPDRFEGEQLDEDEMAAILFTSGGTGRPKGVIYSHKIFYEQTKVLKELFNLDEKETDLPGFPLFSLFTLSMGMTSVIPDMDPSKPSKADPKSLVQNILDTKASFVAGSPAIWEGLGKYCQKNKITLPSVKYLVMFGAPVRNEIHRMFKEVLPNGTTYTPYGATESLPVANISGREVLKETARLTEEGMGTCVGHPVPGTRVKIIKNVDGPISTLNQATELKRGEIGEIIVNGDVVTRTYFNAENETLAAKIYDLDKIWHRIGDMGYLDDAGRLWFCGRKSHKVETVSGPLYTIPCEAIFNNHPGVRRSALVEINKIPRIVIERNKIGKMIAKDKLKRELVQLASLHEHTKEIKDVFYKKTFPVDVRHNIKIDRLKIRDEFQRGQR